MSRRKITRTLLRDGPQPLRRPLEATARSRNEKMTNVYFRKNERSYRSTVQRRFYTVRTEISPFFSRHIFSAHPKHPHSYLYEACSKGRLVFNTTIRTNLVVPRIRRLRPRTVEQRRSVTVERPLARSHRTSTILSSTTPPRRTYVHAPTKNSRRTTTLRSNVRAIASDIDKHPHVRYPYAVDNSRRTSATTHSLPRPYAGERSAHDPLGQGRERDFFISIHQYPQFLEKTAVERSRRRTLFHGRTPANATVRDIDTSHDHAANSRRLRGVRGGGTKYEHPIG